MSIKLSPPLLWTTASLPGGGLSASGLIGVPTLPTTGVTTDLTSSGKPATSPDYVSVQIYGTFVGTVQFEQSNDGINWTACTLVNTVSGAKSTSQAAVGLFAGPVPGAIFRVRCSAFTSGNIGVIIAGYDNLVQALGDISTGSGATAQQIQGAGANASPVTGNPVLIAGSDGTNARFVGVDSGGNLKIGAKSGSGGALFNRLNSAATINATVIKATPGNIYQIDIFNKAATVLYVKFYNKATTPAPATDNALLEWVIGVPAGQRAFADFSDVGLAFAAGISYATVTGVTDTDAVAVAANDLQVNVAYA